MPFVAVVSLALAADFETIALLDAKRFEELAQLRVPQRLGIETIRFHPDGTALFADVNRRVNRRDIYRWDLSEIRRGLDELGLNWTDPEHSGR